MASYPSFEESKDSVKLTKSDLGPDFKHVSDADIDLAYSRLVSMARKKGPNQVRYSKTYEGYRAYEPWHLTLVADTLRNTTLKFTESKRK